MMRYVSNNFILEPNVPVGLNGSNSLFTFQNYTNDLAIVEGSNDAIHWNVLTKVNPNSFNNSTTAFKFLKASTALNVNSSLVGYIDSSSDPLSTAISTVGVEAVMYEETTTPLPANATFTSTARDCCGVSPGTVFRGKYAALYKVTAYQDVAFTLALEASNDGVNWYRISTGAAINLGSSNFSAAFVYAPSFRHTRTVIINGAAPSTKTVMSVILKSL